MNGYGPVSDPNHTQIKSIKEWHESIVDWMLQNPHKTQGEMADHFDKTQPWISTLINTDLFREYRSLRFQQHQDMVSHSVIEHVSGLAGLSLEVLHDRIAAERDKIPLGIVKDSAELTLKALGYGPKSPTREAITLNLNMNGASPAILAAARENMRSIHKGNTIPAQEGRHEEVIDAEIIQDTIERSSCLEEKEDEQPQLPLFSET